MRIISSPGVYEDNTAFVIFDPFYLINVYESESKLAVLRGWIEMSMVKQKGVCQSMHISD